MSGRRRSLRPVGLLGLAWGALLQARGIQLFRLVEGRRPSEGEQVAITVLVARHSVQGLLQVLLPHRLAVPYVVVDALHAASMAAVAVRSPQRRRAALISGAVAALAGLASLRTTTSSTSTRR